MRRYLVFVVLLLLAACSPSRYPDYPDIYYPPVKSSRGLIIVDPGHGGEDLGTKSLKPPILPEKNMNLVTARYLAQALEAKGFHVLLTRHDDTFIPLKERAEFANERRPLLFVSVHYNAAPNKSAKGIEVFYYKTDPKNPRSQASKVLAEMILASLITGTEAPSRGVKHGNFAVIRETQMPAVLVEGGFLTNEEELQKLKNPGYLKRIADLIADGIDRYVS